MRRVVICLVAGLFLVAGCSGDDTPDAAEPNDSTPTVTETTPEPEEETPAEPEAQIEVVSEIKLGLSSTLDAFTFAVDPKGNVFVANVAKARVEVYDAKGKPVNSWGTKGSGPGEFNFTHDDGEGGPENIGGLDIDADDNVFVADSANSRVQKFDKDGTLLVQWGGEGEKNGQFVRPIDVAAADDGSVYVIDDRSIPYRVQHFNPQGRFIDKFGMLELINPGAIDVGPDGSLYVANFDGHNILKYSPDGKLLETWEGGDVTLGQPTDIAVASDGTMYVADADKLFVAVLDPKGEGLFTIDEPNLSRPVGVAVGPDGNLYVADDISRRIFELRVTPP